MEKEKLEKSILNLLETTTLTNKEIAAELGTSYQRVSSVEKRLQKGLGDKIEAVTKATGIKALVGALPFDCDCDERKESLNAKTKYRLVREPSDKDIADIIELSKLDSFEYKHRCTLARLRSHLFSIRYSVLNCNGCGSILASQVKDLMVVVDYHACR